MTAEDAIVGGQARLQEQLTARRNPQVASRLAQRLIGHRGRRVGFGYLVLYLTLFALLIWPLIMLAVGALKSTSPLQSGGVWSLAGFTDMWVEINESGALRNSLIFAVLTTIFSVILAMLLAFLSERTDCPLRTLITPAVLVCATTSTLFYAIGYGLLANQHNGVVNVLFFRLTGVRPLIDIETWSGLIFVESVHSAAFLYLFLVGPFRALDRSLEEAAIVAGASRLRTILTIDARLLTPILSSVVLIGLITGIKSFNIPLVLGGHANLSFLSVRIFRTLQLYQPPHYAQASALALSLTAVILVLLFFQHRVIGRRTYVTVTGKSYRQTPWQLGRWRWIAGTFVAAYMLLGIVLPLAAIVFSSFLPFPGVYKDFGLQNYQALFANPDMPSVLLTTALGAGVGGLVGVLLAFVMAYVAHHANSPMVAAILRGSTLLKLAMPGLVGALALIWAVAPVPGVRQIYGTIWLLMIAFIVSVLTVSMQIASGALRQIGSELEDAARVAGASELRVTLGITARLLLPSLVFAWFLAAITIIGDLDSPLLLSSADTRTVSIQIYRLFDGTQESEAAALLTLILAALLACAGLHALVKRRLPAKAAP